MKSTHAHDIATFARLRGLPEKDVVQDIVDGILVGLIHLQRGTVLTRVEPAMVDIGLGEPPEPGWCVVHGDDGQPVTQILTGHTDLRMAVDRCDHWQYWLHHGDGYVHHIAGHGDPPAVLVVIDDDGGTWRMPIEHLHEADGMHWVTQWPDIGQVVVADRGVASPSSKRERIDTSLETHVRLVKEAILAMGLEVETVVADRKAGRRRDGAPLPPDGRETVLERCNRVDRITLSNFNRALTELRKQVRGQA